MVIFALAQGISLSASLPGAHEQLFPGGSTDFALHGKERQDYCRHFANFMGGRGKEEKAV